MKKMIALLLALCLMAMMVPALAETATEEESGFNLGALLDKADDLVNGPEDGEGAGLSALLGALGGSDGENAEPAFTAVPAESIDQFYGTWTLSKVAVAGLEFPMEMLSLLGIEASGEMTISENTIKGFASFNDGSSDEATSKEAEINMDMTLVDGALNVTTPDETDDEVLIFQLTDAGELVCAVEDVGTVFFTPAA